MYLISITHGDKIRSMSDEELDAFFKDLKNRAKLILNGSKSELIDKLADLDWIKSAF